MQVGDIVRADVRGVIEGSEVYKDDDVEFRLREGATLLLPGFAEGLIGAEKGVAKEIPVNGAGGRTAALGKERHFHRHRQRGEGRSACRSSTTSSRGEVGEGFASLDALRERLRNDIRERVEAQAEEAYRDQAVGALVENAKSIEFPPVMIDREIEHIIADQARHRAQEVEQYLAMIKRTARTCARSCCPPRPSGCDARWR